MQDVSGVGGSGESKPLTSDEIKRYQEDYQKGFDLFQNALTEYNKPNVEYHKKVQLKKVMDEALQVMNETASVALKKGKQAKEQSLSENYETYINDPSDENKKQLMDDIDSLK